VTDAEYAALPEFPFSEPAIEPLCPSCGRREELHEEADVVTHRAAFAVVGTAQLHFLVEPNPRYSAPERPRITCHMCGASWRMPRPSRTMHYYEKTIAKLVAQSKAGRGAKPCACSETQLRDAGISFQLEAVGSGLTDKYEPAWYLNGTKYTVLCPICDGDLLEKHSELTRAGERAAATLLDASTPSEAPIAPHEDWPT